MENKAKLCVTTREAEVIYASTRSAAAELAANRPNSGTLQKLITCAAVLLVGMAANLSAQVTIGDDLSMNLNANLSAGYSADFGNTIQSDHGVTFGGTGDLSGSYYDPNFLSFHLQPYLNESRANSDYQSISNTSGLNANAALFTGSHFPGSISYSRNYNSEGNFGIPGIANYTTRGNGDVFSVGWGITVPDKPNVQASFQEGNNQYSIYGTNTNSESNFKTFSLTSSYTLEGFLLTAGYHHVDTEAQVPTFLDNAAPEKSDSSGDSYTVGLGHRLPFGGSFSSAASRSDTDATFSGGSYNATIDTLNAGLSFAPIGTLSFGSNAQYTDNLAGSLYNAVLSVGGILQPNEFSQLSHALDINNYVNYRVPSVHMTFSGTAEHREQRIFDTDLTGNSFTETANYSNSLLGGYLNVTGGANENTISTRNQSSLGALGSINYSRPVGRWDFSGGFNYAQNQQTILLTYTTTNYGYIGTAGRKLGRRSHWNATATGTKSSFVNQPGTGTYNQSYSTGLSVKWIGVSGTYAKSSGNAILTGTGLAPTPIPVPIVTPTSVVLYGGHAYSFGIGASPVRRLSISGSYSKALSNTFSTSLASNNNSEMITTRIQYQFRQVFFQAGYSKLNQGFSLSGQPPAMLSSYYVGISRWFNFF